MAMKKVSNIIEHKFEFSRTTSQSIRFIRFTIHYEIELARFVPPPVRYIFGLKQPTNICHFSFNSRIKPVKQVSLMPPAIHCGLHLMT